MGLNEHRLITTVLIAHFSTKTCVTGLLVPNYLKQKIRAAEIVAKVKNENRPSDNYNEADIIK